MREESRLMGATAMEMGSTRAEPRTHASLEQLAETPATLDRTAWNTTCSAKVTLPYLEARGGGGGAWLAGVGEIEY